MQSGLLFFLVFQLEGRLKERSGLGAERTERPGEKIRNIASERACAARVCGACVRVCVPRVCCMCSVCMCVRCVCEGVSVLHVCCMYGVCVWGVHVCVARSSNPRTTKTIPVLEFGVCCAVAAALGQGSPGFSRCP